MTLRKRLLVLTLRTALPLSSEAFSLCSMPHFHCMVQHGSTQLQLLFFGFQLEKLWRVPGTFFGTTLIKVRICTRDAVFSILPNRI